MWRAHLVWENFFFFFPSLMARRDSISSRLKIDGMFYKNVKWFYISSEWLFHLEIEFNLPNTSWNIFEHQTLSGSLQFDGNDRTTLISFSYRRPYWNHKIPITLMSLCYAMDEHYICVQPVDLELGTSRWNCILDWCT